MSPIGSWRGLAWSSAAERAYAGRMGTRDPHQLREEAATAVARGKLDSALALYGELEELEPTAAAWPKRVGETYRRLGDAPKAVLAFERAVDKNTHNNQQDQTNTKNKQNHQHKPAHAS